MRIGEVAKKFHISTQTLRYWELVGAIPPVNRDGFGNRDYDSEDLDWVQSAIMMRHSGVTVKFMVQYVKLFKQGPRTYNQRKRLLAGQLKRVDKKLNRLKTYHDLLTWKVRHYDFVDKNYHGKMSKLRKESDGKKV